MKILRYLILCLFTLFLMSCVSPQKIPRCEVNKIIEGNIQDLQNGYSLKIPSNWVAYKDIHCNLTFSPQEKKEKLNSNFDWIRVYVYHSTDEKYYKKFKYIDDFVMNAVEQINENFQKPSIEIVSLLNQKYGEYRILKYNTIFLGNTYRRIEVYYFYNDLGYIIHYNSKIDEFEKYLPDFQKMVESFNIIE